MDLDAKDVDMLPIFGLALIYITWGFHKLKNPHAIISRYRNSSLESSPAQMQWLTLFYTTASSYPSPLLLLIPLARDEDDSVMFCLFYR